MNTDINSLYYQYANQDYLKNSFGKEIWIQVSGYKKLNEADAHFWAAFIPVEDVDTVFNSSAWDCHIGTQGPGFSEDRAGITYESFQYGINRCENIVNYRDFYGIKPGYMELVEEFRLLNNLYHDVEKNTFSAILENGEIEEVVKIKDNMDVFIHLKYLMRYASARQMALLLFFDIRIEFLGGLEENGLTPFYEEIKAEDLYYTIQGNESYFNNKKTNSFLMGKKILYPNPVEDCEYWPYEKEKTYIDFIIGLDSKGDVKTYTCNPALLANNFGDNPAAPHYLTPVFFKKEVLQKYFTRSDIYCVEDGRLSCQSLWSIEIDNDHFDYVAVYLGDLGRDLPENEQSYWRQYNVVTSEKLSEVSFKRDFCGIAADAEIADLKFKKDFFVFQDMWKAKYGWYLFLPLSKGDKYNLEALHIPINSSQSEFDTQVLALVKIMVDSLNEKELIKFIPNYDGSGSLNILENFLKAHNMDGAELHIKFLRNLQGLRSSGTGHRKGQNYEKIKQKFGLKENNFSFVFNDILLKADEFLYFLTNAFLS